MTIDIESIYLTITVVVVMLTLAVITIKRLMNTRSKFTAFLLVIEELIVGITAIGSFVLSYKAMENYEAFVAKYGNMRDIFTYISIYFCASQIVILFFIFIYRAINRRKRLIKNRRIIR